MKYRQWLEIWLNTYVKTTCKARTSNIYRYRVERCIVPHLGEYELRDLSPPILQQFVTDLLHPTRGKPLAANTVNGVISVVQNSLKTAFTLGHIDVYDANKIRRPRTVEKKVECLSTLEQRQIEAHIKCGKKLKFYGIIICLYTGLRLGELLALEWKNVDMDACSLTVEKTCYYLNGERIEDAPKTANSLRTIPFPKQLLPLFKEMYKARTTKYVIEANGKPLSVRSYQRSFELLLNKLKITHKRFHSLRHTFATRALECGMDVKTLAELLGHSNPTVTLKRYAHSMLEYKVQMMNKLGKMFA